MQVLTPRLREQLALYSAEVNGCSLCRAMHAMNARRVGLTDDEVEAARRREACDPAENAAFRLARHILETRGKVDDDVLDQPAGPATTTRACSRSSSPSLTTCDNYFNRFVGFPDADLRRRPSQNAA